MDSKIVAMATFAVGS